MALPLLILFILKAGPFPFACLISLFSFLGLREFYAMAIPARWGEGMAAAVTGGLLPLALLTSDPYRLFISGLTVLVLMSGLLFLFRFREMKAVAGEISFLATGFLYVPLLLCHFILLRLLPLGTSWIFLLLVIVMAGDTFAYYVGSSFGRHKLYPAVSPNKSIEGALGGVAGSLTGALICKATFFPELSVAAAVVAAILLGVLGQLGDLFESMLKRSFGVKDSGTIVPGHGGILDRLDSMLFAAPAAYFCAAFLFRL
ncbi:phosphatidate cytidylyltransferase [Geobacter sp. DSM 9736]|nr:phosphatidate cytidylyltransferase [Geobacter sp. DSM 9736]